MVKLPGALPMALQPCRTSLASTTTTSHCRLTTIQTRNATFIARPRRPYTFTQLIQLSDGSTYTARTTSPQPLYRAAKDTRNTLLWQPSERSLRNVELDEAGRLAAFRERFGRGYDLSSPSAEDGTPVEQTEADESGFADLLSEYAPDNDATMKNSGPKKAVKKRK